MDESAEFEENNVDEVLAEESGDDEVTETAQIIEDHNTPAGDPDDVDSEVEDTHPSTDADIDEHERYDQGL